MKTAIILAFVAACSEPSEPVIDSWSSSTGGGVAVTTTGTTTSTSTTSGLSASTTSPQTETPTDVSPDLTTPETDDSEADEGSETSTDDAGSDSTPQTSTDPGDEWSVCDGRVPLDCVAIAADTSDCPGSVGSCQWYGCVDERTSRASIERIRCFERECDVAPLHDADCLEAWADLAAECFRNDCEPETPSACTVVNSGAWSECHR